MGGEGKAAEGEGDETPLSLGTGIVISCAFRGEQVLVRVALGDTILLASVRPNEAPRPEETVGIGVNPDSLWRIPHANPSWLEAP
jgi:hypothetical protein